MEHYYGGESALHGGGALQGGAMHGGALHGNAMHANSALHGSNAQLAAAFAPLGVPHSAAYTLYPPMPMVDYNKYQHAIGRVPTVTVTPHAIIPSLNEPIVSGALPRRKSSQTEETEEMLAAAGGQRSRRSSATWETMTDDQRDEAQRLKRKEEAFKTALCDAYKKTGACGYGELCRFAHGENELRLPAQPRGKAHPKYKTQLCDKFSTTGQCPYGPRCQFIHKLKKGLPLLDYETLLAHGRISPAREEEITNDGVPMRRAASPRSGRGQGRRLSFDGQVDRRDREAAWTGGNGIPRGNAAGEPDCDQMSQNYGQTVYPKMQVINVEKAYQVNEFARKERNAHMSGHHEDMGHHMEGGQYYGGAGHNGSGYNGSGHNGSGHGGPGHGGSGGHSHGGPYNGYRQHGGPQNVLKPHNGGHQNRRRSTENWTPQDMRDVNHGGVMGRKVHPGVGMCGLGEQFGGSLDDLRRPPGAPRHQKESRRACELSVVAEEQNESQFQDKENLSTQMSQMKISNGRNHWSDMIFGKRMDTINEDECEGLKGMSRSGSGGFSGYSEAELLVQSCDEELLAQGLYDYKYPDCSVEELQHWRPAGVTRL